MGLSRDYGAEIPGQILGLDVDKRVAYVKEPLREDRFDRVRERLADRLGCEFAPALEEFTLRDDDHVATWGFWLNRLVESGYGRVVRGELPDMATLPGVPKKRMFKSQPDKQEQLLEGIFGMMEKQGELLAALAGRIKVAAGA